MWYILISALALAFWHFNVKSPEFTQGKFHSFSEEPRRTSQSELQNRSSGLSQADWADVKRHSVIFSSITMPHPAFCLCWPASIIIFSWSEQQAVTPTTGLCSKQTGSFWWKALIWCCSSFIGQNSHFNSHLSSTAATSRLEQRKRFHFSLPFCLHAALSRPEHTERPRPCLSVLQRDNEMRHIYSNIAGKALWRNPRVAPIALREPHDECSLCVIQLMTDCKGVACVKVTFTVAAHPWANDCTSIEDKQIP